MNELDRLVAHAEQIAAAGESLSAVFAVELAAVWRAYERSVLATVGSITSGSPLAALRTLALATAPMRLLCFQELIILTPLGLWLVLATPPKAAAAV